MRAIKNLTILLVFVLLAACGGKKKNRDGYYYPPNGRDYLGGQICPGYGQTKDMTVEGNFGNGASFVIDIYSGEAGRIAAVGDVYIPSLPDFWAPGLNMGLPPQDFVSCLDSNGYNGTMEFVGAYRSLQIALKGEGIQIQLGSSLSDGVVGSQISGKNIIGDAVVTMQGVSDTFTLTYP